MGGAGVFTDILCWDFRVDCAAVVSDSTAVLKLIIIGHILVDNGRR
jgi:hypothetical protein